MAYADMAEGVDDTLGGEDAIGGDEILDGAGKVGHAFLRIIVFNGR
jgi:hypothetical protein